jgi:hypothetical protein
MRAGAHSDRSLRVSNIRHFMLSGRTVPAAFEARSSVSVDLADS